MTIAIYAGPLAGRADRGSMRSFWNRLAAVLLRLRSRREATPFTGLRQFGIGCLSVSASTTAAEPVARPISNEVANRFRQTVLPELDAAYNLARFLTKNPDAAQDIVQEAFLKALKGFEAFRGGDTRAWIFAIVRNCFHDWLRARRRALDLEVDVHDDDLDEGIVASIASDEDSPETRLLRKSETQFVRDVLMTLPRPLREILVLRELEDLSYREVAEVTSLPIGTVMSRLARARKEFALAWSRHCAQEKNS